MSLLIYKASAGSGKTFTLAVEYIKFLMINPTAYKSILAVTFTNKATAEMKERILQQLYGIWKADPASKPYEDEIQKRLKNLGCTLNTVTLRQRAGKALQNLLHDYSWFRVETIDAFFQEVMRNLARELNLTANLSTEVDSNTVLDNAVDHMMESLTDSSKELIWIEEYIKERIEKNEKWKIDQAVKEFGRNLFNERYMEHGVNMRKRLEQNPHLIDDYKQKLKEMDNKAKTQMKAYADNFFSSLEEAGITPDELSGGAKGIGSYFNKLRKGELGNKVFNKTVEKHLESVENWSSKTSKKRDIIVALAESKLLSLLQEAERERPSCSKIVNTCELSLRHLNKLRLLDSIGKVVQQDNEDNNRFLLSNTNDLLHRLMKEGDANFVFEKIGANLQHVMIDEFQDTSRMQWGNFKLLFSNILAEGKDSLIVGDVKQSIYRWRNGDWNILNNLENSHEFGCKMESLSLSTNRRSEANVITFNNVLFSYATGNTTDPSDLQGYFKTLSPDEPEEEYQKLKNAYADVMQQLPTGKLLNQGLVKVQMLTDEEKDYEKKTIQQLGQMVKELLEKGILPSDITILLRTKNKLPAIATYFETELHQTVVSDEAFRLYASSAVGIIIDAMRYLINTDDKVAMASLRLGYHLLTNTETKFSDGIFCEECEEVRLPVDFMEQLDQLRQMPLYELTEELHNLFGLNQAVEQTAYLFAFFDEVAQYLKDQPADIGSFLKYWDEELCNKAIPSGEVKGIRVMSIHASKGLQSHTVIVPFCDWTLEKDNHDILLWCESVQEEPFNQLDIVPISYSQNMQESFYSKEYEQERLQLWVDNLNLLYVAFTRAEKNLIVMSKQPGKKKNGDLKDTDRVNGLLQVLLPKLAAKGVGSWDEESGCYQLGSLYTARKVKTEITGKQQNRLAQDAVKCGVNMVSSKPHIEFRQSNRSADFIAGRDEIESPDRFINRGRLMHEVFSDISTVDDVDRVLERLMGEGVINSKEECDDIRSEVFEALQMPQAKEWFDGTWKQHNERDIVWLEHDELQMRRPDRVMERDDELVVIDFKFGKPHDKYHQQVQGYMNLLRSMGHQNKQISGYLWYVDEKKIVRV